IVEREAEIVVDLAGLVAVSGDFPDFLDAQTIFLRALAGSEAEIADDLLGERAPGPLADQRLFGFKRNAFGMAGLGIALPVEAEIAGNDAAHRPVARPQHIDRRRHREDVDAKGG